MTDTFLTPGSDMAPLAAFCNIPAARIPEAMGDLETAALTAVGVVEDGAHKEGFRGVGPIVAREVTEYTRGASVVALSAHVLTAPTGFIADGATVRAASGARVPAGSITYQAGWCETSSTAPQWAVTAGLLIARHIYRTQLGNTKAGQNMADGVGFLLPNQAKNILAPYELGAWGT